MKKTTDEYTQKYFVMIMQALANREMISPIIDKIYEDGFIDGANEASLHV